MSSSDHKAAVTKARGPLAEFMAGEHSALADLLAQAGGGSIEAYRQLRQLLLRHIRIEERLLLPMAEKKRGGEPLPIAARLRLDHGALAILMMLPPDRDTLRAIGAVLQAHNPLEEASSGVYEQCEALAGPEAAELLLQCKNTPPVSASPWSSDRKVLEAARRGLIRAGFSASLLRENESSSE